jgi:hypothetical protein
VLCCSASNAEANNSPSALPTHLLQAPACAAWDWRSLLAMEVPGAHHHLLWSGLPMRRGTLALLQQVPVCTTSKCTLIACIHAMLHICVNTHLISIILCMHACMHACTTHMCMPVPANAQHTCLSNHHPALIARTPALLGSCATAYVKSNVTIHRTLRLPGHCSANGRMRVPAGLPA